MLPRQIEKYEESGLLLIPCKQDKEPEPEEMEAEGAPF
jgi:hypothetical protein